ncbi:MAG: hypothetical protein ABW184_13395 [Sphingobium sp.]
MTTGRGARARALWAPIHRLEGNSRVLALFKLANVALAMAWGFIVTFVFVRLLPLAEFRGFLLLVAFANFTISADFGFSTIIYARLRRFRLLGAEGSDFQPRDVAMLFAFMALVVLIGAVAIMAGMASGHIATQRPGLFLAFYLLAAMNIFTLLAKRALGALDRNLLWDAIDAVRRTLCTALLLLALFGLPILLSVLLQIALTLLALIAGLVAVHRVAGMRGGDWLLRGAVPATIWRDYMRDMGATMALTLSDVAAYNAPYIGIAMMTHDPRPLLVFDFVFKISRALTAVIRALTDAMMPRLTDAWHGGRPDAVRARIRRVEMLSFCAAGALAAALLAGGEGLSALLFAGKTVLTQTELALLGALLMGLAMLCVSTFIHTGLGRFGALLLPSLAFFALSVLSVPLGGWLAGVGDWSFATGFLLLYTAAHIVMALYHGRMLRKVARA